MADKFDELEQHTGKIAQWERYGGVAAIRADLETGGTRYVGSQNNQRLAWLWIEREEKRERGREAAEQARIKKEENSFLAVLERVLKEKSASFLLLAFLGVLFLGIAIFLAAGFGVEYFQSTLKVLKGIISVW